MGPGARLEVCHQPPGETPSAARAPWKRTGPCVPWETELRGPTIGVGKMPITSVQVPYFTDRETEAWRGQCLCQGQLASKGEILGGAQPSCLLALCSASGCVPRDTVSSQGLWSPAPCCLQVAGGQEGWQMQRGCLRGGPQAVRLHGPCPGNSV